MGRQVLDRLQTKDVLRAVLHAILFHRLFGTVKSKTFEVLDVTMVRLAIHHPPTTNHRQSIRRYANTSRFPYVACTMRSQVPVRVLSDLSWPCALAHRSPSS